MPDIPARALFAPEILAPCGDEETVRVALAAGADAVFFGVQDGFNARARATNLRSDGLHDIVAEVHRAGARAYLTMNTLVFEDELPTAAKLIARAARAGIDALIVQDPAICALAQKICPEMHLHASTQMTISSAEASGFAERLGVRRVVLPRELSVKEIADVAARSPLELEVFIHGALCVSWSGQCLTSEAWGGRSANRGQCAQSCRLPYELIVDGEHIPTGDLAYLLSPLDLAGHRAIPSLMEAGVHSLKIEGRLKGPAYVETAVRALRRWIDHILADTHNSAGAKRGLAEDLAEASLAYSRGFSDGFFGGSNHQRLVPGRFPRSRGYLLGRVTSVAGSDVEIAREAAAHDGFSASSLPGRTSRAVHDKAGLLDSFGREDRRPLAPLFSTSDDADGPSVARVEPVAGMGVAFDSDDPQNRDEEGGPIFEVTQHDDDHYRLSFGRPGPNLRRVEPGQLVWLTSSPQLQQRAQKLGATVPHGRHPLAIRAWGRAGEPLQMEGRWRDATITVASPQDLAPAQGAGLDDALVRDKVGALGGSPFHLSSLDLDELEPGLHLPVSALKSLRREIVDALAPEITHALRARACAPEADALQSLHGEAAALRAGFYVPEDARVAADTPRILPLVRTDAQLDAVIAAGFDEVELDWMEMVGLGHAVERAKAAGLRVTIATTRIQKPFEEGFDRRIAKLAPDAVLVRHWAGLMAFREAEARGDLRLHGDFSLNVTNSVTATELLHLGLDTLTASHDLHAGQLGEMLTRLPAERVTVVLHHHISTFHTEHCVYAHTLSTGKDWRSCGRPCETHRVALRDTTGQEHPVLVDVGCRNTVFNARAQSAAGLVHDLIRRGVRRFRVEFVWESAEETRATLEAYQRLLRGDTTGRAVVEELAVHEQFGVTLGTMRSAR